MRLLCGKRYFNFSELFIPVDMCYQDPNSLEGRSITQAMMSTSMMAIVGLLQKILDSKRAVEKKANKQKESFKKVCVNMLPIQ
jgi:hypothetical protein